MSGDQRSVIILGDRQLWRHAVGVTVRLYWSGVEKNVTIYKG
jgi:hypothetical protein